LLFGVRDRELRFFTRDGALVLKPEEEALRERERRLELEAELERMRRERE
jgi:hypothetical protein